VKEIVVNNLYELDQVASELLNHISDRRIIAFIGKIGAGKTTFIKAICKHLGVNDVVNSPTFSIINEYQNHSTNQFIYHFDLFRINTIREALELGIEDYFQSGLLCLIEWPEIISSLLPDATVFVTISELPDLNSRLIHIS